MTCVGGYYFQHLFSMNVALFLIGVKDVTGGGGAERFFADFFEYYRSNTSTKFKLYFFTDSRSLKSLQKIGRMAETKNVVVLKNVNNRFKAQIENADLLFKLRKYRIDILHVANYGRHYHSRVLFADRLPKALRPKIVINIVDCEIPYAMQEPDHPKHRAYHTRYDPLFDEVKVDGFFSWYELFLEFVASITLQRKPVLYSITSRFSAKSSVDFDFKQTKKKNEVVWAARMVEQKRPLMFVEAVKQLRASLPTDIFASWKFRMFGKGHEYESIRHSIKAAGLEESITIEFASDLSQVFRESRVFVSTQDYENFPSQSMNEAMLFGNVIVARNVGQTSFFLKEAENGVFIQPDSPKGLSIALSTIISQDNEVLSMMGEKSIQIARTEHTQEKFLTQIEEFWNRLFYH